MPLPSSIQTKIDKRPLPKGWRWEKLGDICEINPRRPLINRADEELTTFIQMSSVDGVGGIVAQPEQKALFENKGYTYFAEDDVIFAKITPCMENGKHAIVRNLIDGIGFGSTEFHVIRPNQQIIAEWIWHYLRQPKILQEATSHFSGAVGQQRVPDKFLKSLEIPVPPLDEQKRIAARLDEQMRHIEQARQAAEESLSAAWELPSRYLREVFENDVANTGAKIRLGDILKLRKEVVHPYNNPKGPAVFVGLEHIEANSGVRAGSVEIEMSKLTGRKPKFYKGDIVYGYLRPYLNKVWIAEFDGLCSVDQYVYNIDDSKADVGFVAWFMRSPVYLERAPIATTPGQLPRIRTEEVASVEINLPPLEEQKRISLQISEQHNTVNKLIASLESQLAEINELPSALLRQAFAGEL